MNKENKVIEKIEKTKEVKTKQSKTKKKKTFNFDKFNKKVKKIGKQMRKRLKLDEERFNLFELLLLILIAFIFGIFVSEAIVFDKGNNDSDSNPSSITSITNNNEIEKAYNTILEKYIEEIDEEELKKAAINGMLNYLGDSYSTYFDEAEKEEFEEELEGTYYGLGLKLTKYEGEYPFVVEVFDNTPASKLDFRVGDYVVEVEGKDILEEELANVVANIKGELNKTVQITIKRGEEELEKEIGTQKIDIPSVYSQVFEEDNKKIGYISITIFAENTDEQFKEHLNRLEQEKIDSLIIDVRSNFGGHLSTVTNILNEFFTKNDVIYQRDKKGIITKTYGTGNRKDYEVVVLVNQASASASEILASAFKEISGSEIVGMNTYGKGTVQQTVDLATGGMLKITTEIWLTSQGNEINGIGVAPTIEVELEDKYYEDPTIANDNQLQKALEILKGK